jgi:glycosyltransferase involved in cell wall biosynthesis
MTVRESASRNTSESLYVIMIPIYNDWAALEQHLTNLDLELQNRGFTADLMIVDDGSTSPPPSGLLDQAYRALDRINLLTLRRNLGHQRAIAIGLAYLEATTTHKAVVVMDGDGEDDPADVPRLLETCLEQRCERIVFAERSKRSESVSFRVFYALYKLVHLCLTGIRVRVGNFSVIPRERLCSMVVVSELWNHYAAAVFKSRQPISFLPACRARRLDGRSTMNFVDLVAHGLAAISVYGEIVGVRLLVLACLLVLFALAGIVSAVVVRLATSWAIPGWATSAVGILLVVLLMGIMLAFLFSFIILVGRQGLTFLPTRDYVHFIKGVRCLRERSTDERISLCRE